MYKTREWYLGVSESHIDINIPQQLQYGEHNVVDIAEPARLALLGMMQSTTPVYCDICRPAGQFPRCGERCTRVLLTEGEDVVKDRAIVSYIELCPIFGQSLSIFGRHPTSHVRTKSD